MLLLCILQTIYSSFIAINQNPHAFLRINILSFQIHHNQPINLINIKTQIELKEKHRYARDNIESKNPTERKIGI